MTPSFLVQVGKFCIENIIKPAKKYFSTLHSRDLFYAYYKKLSLASNMTYLHHLELIANKKRTGNNSLNRTLSKSGDRTAAPLQLQVKPIMLETNQLASH